MPGNNRLFWLGQRKFKKLNRSQPSGQKPAASKRHQTEKARTAKLLKTQARKLRHEFDVQEDLDNSFLRHSTGFGPSASASHSDHIRHNFFSRFFADYKPQDFKAFQRDRARAVFSLVKALVAMITNLFAQGQSQGQNQAQMFHVINTHMVDDTSTRMRGPGLKDRTSVYTVMNSIQDLHLRLESDYEPSSLGCCLSFRIPTPLLCLENANANTIYKNFLGSAMVTSDGIGRMFELFGLKKDLIQRRARWQTFVFIGDALKANDSAFRKERQQLSKSRRPNHLALRVRCCIHQLSLIRRPAVLIIPRLWTTIVRLSHLFEVLSFRKAFATALAGVLCKAFVYTPVRHMPPESSHWQKAAKSLGESFRCSSKMRLKGAQDILTFLNGDLSSDCVFHFCVGNCCSGKEDSLRKCLQLLVPFMSRGFAVPLLYRFKHFDQAVSYITFTIGVHKLLPRTLSSMEMSSAFGREQQLIDELMAGLDLSCEGADGTAAAWLAEGLFEDNFAVQNAKRKQLVQQEVTKPGFGHSAVIVDHAIKPMDSAMNRLLRHSERITRLALLSDKDPEWAKTAEKTRELFLLVASGGFGQWILQQYSSLISDGLGPLLEMDFGAAEADLWQVLLTILVHLMTDTWKRFIFDHQAPQYQMFSLLGLDLPEFVSKWDDFQAAKASCPCCFDSEFSGCLLASFPTCLAEQPPEIQALVQRTVQLLLHDIATHTPVSTDSVEVKNGQVQHTTSRRGNMAVKTPGASRESSFLQTFIRQFELQRLWVETVTLPSKMTVSSILKRCGMMGFNQYSSSSAGSKQDPQFIFGNQTEDN